MRFDSTGERTIFASNHELAILGLNSRRPTQGLEHICRFARLLRKIGAAHSAFHLILSDLATDFPQHTLQLPGCQLLFQYDQQHVEQLVVGFWKELLCCGCEGVSEMGLATAVPDTRLAHQAVPFKCRQVRANRVVR